MASTSVEQYKTYKEAIKEVKEEEDVQYRAICRPLDQLPIEVIDKILEFSHPNGLAEISVTCHKLRDAARKNYQLKRRCGLVTIDTFLYHPYADFKEEADIYKIRFRNLIPNVKVIFQNRHGIADAFNFIKSNCCEHLKVLKLENKIEPWADNFVLNELNIIADQIKSVEFLILNKYIQLENVPWTLFPNLRALSSRRVTCIDQVFPKLRTLCISDEGWGYNIIKFDRFLRNNTKLKSIYCRQSENNIYRCILSTEFQLKSVVLNFEFEQYLEQILDNLQECSDRKTIESVEIHALSLNETTLRRLERIENVKHIHSTTYSFKSSGNIHSFPYIQRLCLRVYDKKLLTQQGLLNEFLKRFPNLEKLRLKCLANPKLMLTRNMVSGIIASLPKLKYLHFFDFKRKEMRNILEWYRIQSSLKNVHSLNIHFDLSPVTSRDVWCPICCESNSEIITYMDTVLE